MSTALAAHQVNKLKRAWRDGSPVLQGEAPDYGSHEGETMYHLLNTYTVLDVAQKLALKAVPEAPSVDHPDVVKYTRNLILTEDFGLMNGLLRYSRDAVSGYTDSQLATMIADKRLADFKLTLDLRTVLSMDSPATYGWILYQQQKNIFALGRIPSFDEIFARSAIKDLVPTVIVG